uniref:Uncharacterized protein n=1 Tax=Cynoglossus semilaevis TaxID=244447 RepID=A0A3P8VCG8_CYNSE
MWRSGRRGTKRKAEAALEEKPCVEDNKETNSGEEGNVYGRNAEEVKTAILAAHPELTVILNPEKPRRNSFEITLVDGGKGEEDEKGQIQK